MMNLNDILGLWRIVGNDVPGELQLWRSGNTLVGRVTYDTIGTPEDLRQTQFQNDRLTFHRPNARQDYSATIWGDHLHGTFTDAGRSYDWHGRRLSSPLAQLISEQPTIRLIDYRSGAPSAQRVLVIVEERLLGALLATLSNGVSILTRYFDDLQNEGWDVVAYSYDVQSDENNHRGHYHRPSEFLQLYRFVRRFYETARGRLNGVTLVGDFPAAGVATLEDRKAGNNTEQHELDYFAVDAVLADPTGYWEWMGIAPMLPPGSTGGMRLPWDESRHPGGHLYIRDQWSAPAFLAHDNTQWQVHHAERNAMKRAADPKFWVGRITASQSAWRTEQGGLTYSDAEEVRLLTGYFHRNHEHRTRTRERKGYIFIDTTFAGEWQRDVRRMERIILRTNIVVNADDAALASSEQGSVSNYLESFTKEFLVCQYVMHSDFLNHYFFGPRGDVVPTTFPNSFASEGSAFSVPVPRGQNSIKALHHMALTRRSEHPRFYLLGGCDVGDILHRPQVLVEGERISPATPLHRQYGAQNLGVTYLMRCTGLVVVAHNTTNTPADYTSFYEAWERGHCTGEAMLQLMLAENVAGQVPHPYRNIMFGDPTLKLSY